MKTTAFTIIENQDLSEKTFLITGPYSGLGAITTEALLKANAKVIIAGRNPKKQADFLQKLKTNFKFKNEQIDASHTLDLGDLKSVQLFAQYINKTYSQIDTLINNAGIMFTSAGKTKNGFEIQFGTNVIGPFLLAKLLVNITKRQVWLSSKAHESLGAPRINLETVTFVDESNYDTILRYQQSKLGDILLSKYFNEKYTHLITASVHPGVVKTNLTRHMTFSKKMSFIIKNPLSLLSVLSMIEPEEGAATQVMVATIPDTELKGGAYYTDCKLAKEAESAKNMEDAKKLFDYCDRVTKDFQS